MSRRATDIWASVREQIDYAAIFEEFCGTLTGRGEWRDVRCLFHEDANPSMGVNLSHGGFRCMACNASGDFIDFYKRVRSVNFVEAVQELAARVGIQWDPSEREHEVYLLDNKRCDGSVPAKTGDGPPSTLQTQRNPSLQTWGRRVFSLDVTPSGRPKRVIFDVFLTGESYRFVVNSLRRSSR